MTRRRLLWLLAPTGTLAAHSLAYGPLAGGHHDDGAMHAYLPVVAVVAVPAAIVAVLWATTHRRGRVVQLPSVRSLVAAQLGVFAVQEVFERLASRVSLSELLDHPAVRWGLALQAVTGAAALLATRLLRRTIGALLTIARRVDLVLALPLAVVSVAGSRRIATGNVWRPPSRAPPVVPV
jgi:hypothetical protein